METKEFFRFLFWVITYSFLLFIALWINKFINISSPIISLFFMGLILALGLKLLRKFRLNDKWKMGLAVAFILIILLVNVPLETSNTLTTSIGEKISSFLQSLSKGITKDSCPQLAIPLVSSSWSNPFLAKDVYDGWVVRNYDLASEMAAAFTGQTTVFCNKGNEEGETLNYWYCGEDKITYMQKTEIKEDNTIGKTIRITFVNVYDENQNFIKTICGDDPEKVSEREFEQLKADARKFFN